MASTRRHRYKGGRAVPAKPPPWGPSVLLRTSIRTRQPVLPCALGAGVGRGTVFWMAES